MGFESLAGLLVPGLVGWALGSLLGTWIPFGLIFASTYLAGVYTTGGMPSGR